MSADESRLELVETNVYADAIGEEHGLWPAQMDGLADCIGEAQELMQSNRDGSCGFMELPYNDALVEQVKAQADRLRARFETFVVNGIGGSALGNIAVHGALNHPFHNLLAPSHPARKGAPRIFVLDNIDPALMRGFLELIEPELEGTAFNVITKSGATAETMAQFLFVRDRLQRAGRDPRENIVLTTGPDPEESLLRRIADEGDYAALPIPPNVGGRFSVLSAVGLLSAAVGGIDVEGLLAGAAAMDRRLREADYRDNPAARYAAALYLFYGKGKPITVLMAYSDALRRLADWYCQLWAESLGKRHGLGEQDLFVGPTPIGAVGVTDQHSVMQLYQDGRFDKVLTLLEVEDTVQSAALAEGQNPPICQGEAEPELSYLAEASFGQLFQSELQATRSALRDKCRPNMSVRVPGVTARDLGELFMFFEYAVVYSGHLYGVNPFNQPGVELGKQYTYGLMGRPGYEPPPGDR